jgi:patatin-like phospholipase/acyl hydrolase
MPNNLRTGALSHVRVWLSGSVPEKTPPEEEARIQKFVERLAGEVFKAGGTIVHGCHPSLLGPLTAAARHYQNETGDRAPLALFVSKWYLNRPKDFPFDLNTLNQLCAEPVQETREAVDNVDQGEEKLRGMSNSLLRGEMVRQSNTIVAIGGKWWTIAQHKAGVSEEISLASDSGLPLFLLGGMGGAVAGLVAAKPELLRNCANGLSLPENESLAAESNAEEAVARVIAQLGALPPRPIAGKGKKPFRILCLDGGGIRGVYTAAVLAYWEKALNLHQTGGRRLIDHFDLVVGTSTGGILAIGLVLGMSAREMQRFYEEKGTSIFGSGEGLDKWWHSFRHWFTSKFDQEALRKELQAAYATSPIAKSKTLQTEWLDDPLCKLMIPVYNAQTDRPFVFRSPYGRFRYTDKGWDPVTLALSTAAAPTYFDPVKSTGAVAEVESLDGGVWANSPVGLAIGEAIAELNVPVEQIRLLGIGTTHTTQLHGHPTELNGKVIGAFIGKLIPHFWGAIVGKLVSVVVPSKPIKGLVGWVANIAGLLMKAQSQTSDLVGQQILGDRYMRVDTASPYGELDDVTRISHFAALGEEAAKNQACFGRVQSLFLS